MKTLIALACALFATSAVAQVGPTYPSIPQGYQQITSLSSATSLTVPKGSNWALICASGTAVMWRDDGTAPTATIGMPLASGQCLTAYESGNLKSLQFIQTSASATLNISYYR